MHLELLTYHTGKEIPCVLALHPAPELPFYPNLNLALSPPLDITAAASNADFRGGRPRASPGGIEFLHESELSGIKQGLGELKEATERTQYQGPQIWLPEPLKILGGTEQRPLKGETELEKQFQGLDAYFFAGRIQNSLKGPVGVSSPRLAPNPLKSPGSTAVG